MKRIQITKSEAEYLRGKLQDAQITVYDNVDLENKKQVREAEKLAELLGKLDDKLRSVVYS